MIEKKLILQSIEALRSLNEQYNNSSEKKPLLENDQIYLQVQLKKIPKTESIKMIKVHLPHPLLKDTDEVCLIMGDLDKKNHKAEIEPDILHYKEMLSKHDISCISEILTLRQLRTEYKPYEAKQKLLAAYEMFLCDKKIAECLPRVLGKHFFRKRKFPIQLDMKSANLKQQVEKALSTKVFSVTGHGNSCCSEVGFLDMDNTEIVANILKVAETLSNELPGSWKNVMGMYLKTSKSKAIPIYMSYDNSSDIDLKDEKTHETVEDELSTIPNVKVKVFEDGRVRTFRLGEDSDGEDSGVQISDSDLLNCETSLKKNQKSKKVKRELTLPASTLSSDEESTVAVKTDSEMRDSPSELLDSEVLNSDKSIKKNRKSKKPKTELMSNVSSNNENAVAVKTKKKIKDCSANEFSDSELLNSEKSVKKNRKSKQLAMELTLSSGDEKAVEVNSKKKMRECSPSKQEPVKKKSKMTKRTESEPKLSNNVETKRQSNVPVQDVKRKEVEVISKKDKAQKNSNKNKKKVKHPRN